MREKEAATMHLTSSRDRILKPGRNCWRVEQADKAAFLIDGRKFFEAVYHAARQATSTLYILGWEIHSRIRLTEKAPPLDVFLDNLARSRPKLNIYLLIWDFAMLFALEREMVPLYSLGWKTHRRVHFHSDGHHPVAASHHEKVVVVDDQIAFCGGLDLTKSRWDTPAHQPANPKRKDPSGLTYGPFHDVQVVFSGPAAQGLGDLFRRRWKNATGEKLPLPDKAPLKWPERITPELNDIRMGISRTRSAFGEVKAVEEIKLLYTDAISHAKQSIYLENQYFSSCAVREAIESSLSQTDGPEIILVFSKRSMGWLEEGTMDVLRSRLIQRLLRADRFGRLRVYYPHVPGLEEICLKIHAKIMVVDERLATIGSANTNNRSMGLDSECNVTIEADDDPEVESALARFRNTLLAEHLDCSSEDVARAIRETGSIITAVESLQTEGRSLRTLPLEVPEWAETLLPEAEWVDPEQPLRLEEWMEFDEEDDPRTLHGSNLIKLGIAAFVLVGLIVLWRFSPLQIFLNVDRLVAWADFLRDSGSGPVILIAMFLGGSLIAFPVTVLIGASALLFGPWEGFLYSAVGSFGGAALSYSAGRFLGRDMIRKIAGKRLNSLSRGLAKKGILSVALVRMIPVAPFTLVNVVAGASRIGFRDFMLGTVFGMLPGLAAVTLFSDQLKRFLQQPDPWLLAVLVGLAALVTGMGYLLKRLFGGKLRHDRQPTG